MAVAEEINRNITDITSVIEQTSLDANETMEASLSVAEQAKLLEQMMKKFKCA